MLRQRGFQIGRVFGINIRIDWSWFFIFILISWNLSVVFGQIHSDWGDGLRWGIAVIAALLFFASVLAHELAHSVMARSFGVPVRNITLMLFGGMANIRREPPSPRAEFLITIVGPITSVVLGIFFLLMVAFSVGPISLATMTETTEATAVAERLGPAATLLLWLGPVNILLGIFNLVPGFPLDGGRILRSILWAITDNLRRATRWAAGVGQAVAWLMIVTGIAMIFGVQVPFFGTGFISGIWLAFIGWFLNSAAVQSYQRIVVEDILEGVPVTRLMRNNPPTAPATISVSDLVHNYVMGTDDHSFPVQEDEQMSGMVTLEDIRAVPREQWDTTLVREIMTPDDKLATVEMTTEADEAFHHLNRQDVRQLPVLQNGRLVGILRRRDIMKWLQLQET